MSEKNNRVILDENGDVVCNRSIILSIIGLATKEISGVASMDHRILSKMKSFLLPNFFEGVKVKFFEKSVIIDVYINVYYNYNVAEIACKVQENIKNEIYDMVNLVIDGINVHVIGVEFLPENSQNIATI